MVQGVEFRFQIIVTHQLDVMYDVSHARDFSNKAMVITPGISFQHNFEARSSFIEFKSTRQVAIYSLDYIAKIPKQNQITTSNKLKDVNPKQI